MPGAYIPAIPSQYLDDNGDPADSFQLFAYESGTSTKQATYSDVDLTSANANPIVLDSAGRATIFLLEDVAYKFVLATSTASDPPDPGDVIWTRDGIRSIPDTANTDVVGSFNGAASAGIVCYLNSSGLWDGADADTLLEGGNAYAVGIVVKGTAGSPFDVTVRVAGRVTGLSGLSAGTLYYVSSTAGALTSTKPNGARVVGVADSSTSLILTPSIPFHNALVALKNIGFSNGQASTGNNNPTTLTSYDTTILANELSQAGQCLVIEGTLSIATTGATKSAAVKVGSASAVTFFSTTDTTSGQIVPFRLLIRYRTSTTGGLAGLSFGEAATAGNPVTYLVNASITGADWTANQTLSIVATSASTGVDGDVKLTDYNVYVIRGTGTLV